jgi:heme exporter protein A
LFHRELAWVGHAASLKDDLTALENLQAIAMLGGDASRPRRGAWPHWPRLAWAAASACRPACCRPASAAAWCSRGWRCRRRATPRTTPLWVLDEPFNALDVRRRTGWPGWCARQLAHGGIVVLTSHQAIPLDGLADPVTVAL